MSEVALRLDRLGSIDAETKQRFLRRLFSRHPRDVLDFISIHKTDSPTYRFRTALTICSMTEGAS
jgi:hypothetical protein